MKKFHVKLEKLAGAASEKESCGVFSRRINFIDGSLGTLASVMFTKSESGVDFGKVISDLFEIATKKLEDCDPAYGLLEPLILAREATGDYLAQIDATCDFVYLFFYQNICYIVRFGEEVKIFLKKDSGACEISFDEGSGYLKEGQIFLVATAQFLNSFPQKDFLAREQIGEELIDELATEISANDAKSKMAAIFGFVHEDLEEAEKHEETSEMQPIKSSEVQKEGINQELSVESIERKRSLLKISSVGQTSKKLLLSFWQEVRSLRRGDIRAVFRLRRNVVIFAILLLVVLASSVTLAIYRKNSQEKNALFGQYLARANTKYAEGAALVQLNSQRARELLVEAEKDVKSALEISKNDESANKLAGEILAKLKETETQKGLTFRTFFETDEAINSISISEKSLVVLTSSKAQRAEILSKKGERVSGVSGGEHVFLVENSIFVARGDEIYKYDLVTDKKEPVAKFSPLKDLAVFLGNVYVLGGNQIYKFTPYVGGYSDKTEYLNGGVEFGDNSKFSIDGYVWVSHGTGVLKFLRGEREDFEISGLTSSVSELGLIYTNADWDNLYIVDKSNSALLVVGKDGIYKKIYQSSEIARASDLVIDASEKKVYLASGSKVLEADLEPSPVE